MNVARVRTVVLAAGSSVRMGWDKLLAPFDGVPLARRVVLALAELRPFIVASPGVAALVGDVPGVRLVVTPPTAGLGTSLALAHAAIAGDAVLAVVPCDLPFLDAARVGAFVARVPDGADLAYPVVADVPGHPVVWSPAARTRIPALPPDAPPAAVRRDAGLRVVSLVEADDAYVVDVDTPSAWEAAEERARRSAR